VKLSEWRPGFTAWLDSQVQIDQWSLDNPETGKVHAFLPPLRSLLYDDQERGQGVQHFFILQRFSNSLGYAALPLAEIEGYYQSLAIRLLTQAADMAPLKSSTLLTVDEPILVTEYGDGRGDWLVTMQWAFTIYFDAEVEAGTPGKPQPVNALRAGIYRASLDGSTLSKDTDIQV
jgi:hypothetical protein